MSSTMSRNRILVNIEVQRNVQNEGKGPFMDNISSYRHGQAGCKRICRPSVTVIETMLLEMRVEPFISDVLIWSLLFTRVCTILPSALWLLRKALGCETSNVNINHRDVKCKINQGTSCSLWIFIFYKHLLITFLKCLVNNLAGYTIYFININQNYYFEQNMTEMKE